MSNISQQYPRPSLLQVLAPPSVQKLAEVTFLAVCLLVLTVGNGCVIWVNVDRIKRQGSARLNVLMLSLSLADILQGLCQIGPVLANNIRGEWVCGEFVCKLHAVTRSMLANISISTLALIAVERFVHLDSADRGDHFTGYVIAMVLVWALQCGVAAPVGIWNTVMSYPRVCSIPFDQLTKSKEYTVIVQPLTSHASADQSLERRNRKVTTICLTLAVVFTVNLTPFQTALIVMQMGRAEEKIAVLNILEYLWLLTVINSCLNPFIYGIFLKDFRLRLFSLTRELFCHTDARAGISTRQMQSATL
ncbi:QRFP-like peptide receptor [Physella acuta]|uniref:QRFP-like peptide receptor n=1 Tax=Physella acuta TaxID=109671 RepID=UPI0027DD0E38|nr:QRFP-like peptide receptor [Physella acuta]